MPRTLFAFSKRTENSAPGTAHFVQAFFALCRRLCYNKACELLQKPGAFIMMLENYHTHTHRCHHAVGEDRAYVEAAIRAGIRVLGFSDHAPYPFPSGYRSGMRLQPEETEGYFRSLLDLKQEYQRDITLKIGFEAEYFPALFPALLEHLKPYPLDYLILGHHFSKNEEHGQYFGAPTRDPAGLTAYVDQVIEGLQTGAFTYLAHPDLIHCPHGTPKAPDTRYLAEMRRLCEAAKALGIPLEINLLGILDGRQYPNEVFFSLAAEVGNQVLVGCDAHDPRHLLGEATYQKALDLARRCGITLLEHPTLRSPFGGRPA